MPAIPSGASAAATAAATCWSSSKPRWDRSTTTCAPAFRSDRVCSTAASKMAEPASTSDGSGKAASYGVVSPKIPTETPPTSFTIDARTRLATSSGNLERTRFAESSGGAWNSAPWSANRRPSAP